MPQLPKLKWIGLTGGIATGKSSVSRLLEKHGYAVIDADQLARDVVQAGTKGYDEVLQAFGPNAIAPSGELNRKAIGDIVFRDRAKLSLLENIIHPRVRALALEKKNVLEARGETIAFYDVPLLFEKNLKTHFDQVVVVTCAANLQLERLMKRDGISREEAERRIANQLPMDVKVAGADFVIENNSSLGELEKRVVGLIKKLETSNHQAKT